MQLVERVCNQSVGLAADEGYLHLPWDKSIGVTNTGAQRGLTNHPSQTTGLLGLIGLSLKGVSLSVERMNPVKHRQIKKHTMKGMICIRKCPFVNL